MPPEPAGGWDSLSPTQPGVPQGDTCRAVPIKRGLFVPEDELRVFHPPAGNESFGAAKGRSFWFSLAAAKGRAGKATALCLNALLLLPERAFQPSDREKAARKTQHKLQLRVTGGAARYLRLMSESEPGGEALYGTSPGWLGNEHSLGDVRSRAQHPHEMKGRRGPSLRVQPRSSPLALRPLHQPRGRPSWGINHAPGVRMVQASLQSWGRGHLAALLVQTQPRAPPWPTPPSCSFIQHVEHLALRTRARHAVLRILLYPVTASRQEKNNNKKRKKPKKKKNTVSSWEAHFPASTAEHPRPCLRQDPDPLEFPRALWIIKEEHKQPRQHAGARPAQESCTILPPFGEGEALLAASPVAIPFLPVPQPWVYLQGSSSTQPWAGGGPGAVCLRLAKGRRKHPGVEVTQEAPAPWGFSLSWSQQKMPSFIGEM